MARAKKNKENKTLVVHDDILLESNQWHLSTQKMKKVSADASIKLANLKLTFKELPDAGYICRLHDVMAAVRTIAGDPTALFIDIDIYIALCKKQFKLPTFTDYFRYKKVYLTHTLILIDKKACDIEYYKKEIETLFHIKTIFEEIQREYIINGALTKKFNAAFAGFLLKHLYKFEEINEPKLSITVQNFENYQKPTDGTSAANPVIDATFSKSEDVNNIIDVDKIANDVINMNDIGRLRNVVPNDYEPKNYVDELAKLMGSK